eukprot:g683.t1
MQVPVATPDWRLEEKPTSSFEIEQFSSHRPLADFCNLFDFGAHGTEASHLIDEPLTISPRSIPYVKSEKFDEVVKCETELIRRHRRSSGSTVPFDDTYSLPQCTSMDATDMFDMSSFFHDQEKAKHNGGGDFEHLLNDPPPVSPFPEGDGVKSIEEEGEGEETSPSDHHQPSRGGGGSTETVENEDLLEADASVESVVMGIPYYVACQWQQMQQQHQQQQQAVMMLWWQAYLSGAYNMMGPKSLPAASNQINWPFSHGLNFPGVYNDDSLSHQLVMVDEAQGCPQKRRRKIESTGDGGGVTGSKKGRRSKQTERVCKNCGTNATPFWRKDKQDGLPLCNACGLYLSKNDAPRPKVLWKYNERSPMLIV